MTGDSIAGLRVLITGGASGIGRTTAGRFLARGATVAVLDVTSDGLPEGAVGLIGDLRSTADIRWAFAEVERLWGALDVLVNNAGISAVGSVEENADDEWLKLLDINVVGVARASAAALPLLRRSSCASIVNVSSIAATAGLPRRALYSASKGAVAALTLAMAADHVREGIRVNAVAPGTVATPFVDRMLEGFDDPVAERGALNARQATGRMVTPEEVADAIVFLSDPRGRSTTGTILAVDGGMSGLRVRPE
jgi:NAD(P)-dependent dehydrogenase (short-subunit alcohol dehydrogenase family)